MASFRACWNRLAPAVQSALSEAGFEDPVVLAHAFSEPAAEEIDDFLLQINLAVYTEEFLDLVDSAREPSAKRVRLLASTPAPTMAVAVLQAQRAAAAATVIPYVAQEMGRSGGPLRGRPHPCLLFPQYYVVAVPPVIHKAVRTRSLANVPGGWRRSSSSCRKPSSRSRARPTPTTSRRSPGRAGAHAPFASEWSIGGGCGVS